MAVHERPHNNFVGILSVQHLSVAIFPRYQHFFIVCDCIWPHKVLQHWHTTTTPCLLCTSFVNIFWQIFCFRCFDTIGYYYYYTWVLLWWRCRTTAAGPPYNVSDRTVTISVRNCSAGTQHMSGSQSTGKHSLNSIVFSSLRKATKVGAFLTWVGREFQALAAAAGKARSPSVERRVDG